MYHYMLDSYNCFKTRLEDTALIFEILERIPYEMGIKTTMPPFVLPYFNGVVPEDCGISAFIFLEGGHFTIHTFSYRECYFIDFVSPKSFDEEKLTRLITRAFPTDLCNTFFINRIEDNKSTFPIVDEGNDFGPHVFLEIKPLKQKFNMGYLFEILDNMPTQIDMTPIMRPYVIKNGDIEKPIYSGLTMIAESHISIHYFASENKAYFDIFSCKFFDKDFVLPKIIEILGGDENLEYTYISRGSKYHYLKKTKDNKIDYSQQWIK
ncbi:MAG: S-adenosylmethionine decarboxylase [Eubacteriaceae bacterium]